MTGTPPSTSMSARALLSKAVVSEASFDTTDPTHVRKYSPPRPTLSLSSWQKPSPVPAPLLISAPSTTRQRQRQPSTDQFGPNSFNSVTFTDCYGGHREFGDHCPMSSGFREYTYSNSPSGSLDTSRQGASPRLEPSLLPHSIHSQPLSQPSYALQNHGRMPSGSRKRTFSSASNRSGTARRPANLESPVHDPYRSRKSSASAKGIKNGRFKTLRQRAETSVSHSLSKSALSPGYPVQTC